MNADAMTDEQYRIYKFSNFFDLKNLPNDEFERSKRFEDSNIFNCSSVIASAFICHLAHRLTRRLGARVAAAREQFRFPFLNLRRCQVLGMCCNGPGEPEQVLDLTVSITPKLIR